VDRFLESPGTSKLIKSIKIKKNKYAKGEKMNTEHEHVHPVQENQAQSLLPRVGHFLRHYVEMCLVCCIGGFALNFLFFTAAARIGYPGLLKSQPSLSIMIIAVLLAIPMLIWMRIRGHDWRPTLEMSIVPVVLAILIVGANWLNLLPKNEMRPIMTDLVCPAMLIPMLFRLDMYTSSHASHQHHMHASHGDN
jgi:hypothetical protein